MMSRTLNKKIVNERPLSIHLAAPGAAGRQAQAVTSGLPHFFGYYDKCPWSADGRQILAMRASFQDRPPTEHDSLMLGTVDVASGEFTPFAETTAWCWQQGTMLQWMPSGEVIYNARREGRLIAVIHNLSTGQRRELPRPIYAVSSSGKEAISLNFHRLQTYRPGYGYPAGVADRAETYAPEDDGLWRIDLQTGREQLIFSIAQAKAIEPYPAADGVPHWFNHITYNPDGSRFCFLHRFKHADRGFGPWVTRLFTLNADGSDPFLLNPYGMVSHYAWRDREHLIAWATRSPSSAGKIDARYVLMKDHSRETQLIGDGVLTRDGHMTYSPDGRWLLTDEYPDPDRKQPLLLFNLATSERVELGRFEATLKGEIRCDLHPRWNRDGTQVCFDSSHRDTRQIYVMAVG